MAVTSRERLRRAARNIAGIVVGIVALWAAFRGLDPQVVARELSRVDPLLTLGALATTLAALAAMTLRWQLLFYPDSDALRFHDLFRAMVLGQMVNIIVPLRFGEVVRVYALAERAALSPSRIFATVAIEKVLDVLLFGASLALVLASWGGGGDAFGSPPILAASSVAVFAMLWLIIRRGDRLLATAARLFAWVPGVRRRLAGIAASFMDGFSALRTTGGVVPIVVASLLMIATSTLTNWLLFRAFEFELSMTQALALLVVVKAGSVPPSLPGRIGVANYLTVVALTWFGVTHREAAAFAIVLYVVALLPKVAMGAAYVGARRGRLTWRHHHF